MQTLEILTFLVQVAVKFRVLQISKIQIQDFKYFIGYKDAEKTRHSFIVCSEMSIYMRDFDKTTCMCFLIKEGKVFDKYNEIWEKLAISPKGNLMVNLHIIKKSLKAEKKINTKEIFQYFWITIIVIDSVYRKDENYYLKVFSENIVSMTTENILMKNIYFRNILMKNIYFKKIYLIFPKI